MKEFLKSTLGKLTIVFIIATAGAIADVQILKSKVESVEVKLDKKAIAYEKAAKTNKALLCLMALHMKVLKKKDQAKICTN